MTITNFTDKGKIEGTRVYKLLCSNVPDIISNKNHGINDLAACFLLHMIDRYKREILLTKSHIISMAVTNIPINKISGIYFLIQNDEIIYIGQSYNVTRRIKEHKRKEFDKIFFIEIKDNLLRLAMESIYIKSLTPKYNYRIEDINYRLLIVAVDELKTVLRTRVNIIDRSNRLYLLAFKKALIPHNQAS